VTGENQQTSFLEVPRTRETGDLPRVTEIRDLTDTSVGELIKALGAVPHVSDPEQMAAV